MFGIPWRLIVGLILGAVIVKESRRACEFYDSTKKKTIEIIRKAKAKWNSSPPASDEPAA